LLNWRFLGFSFQIHENVACDFRKHSLFTVILFSKTMGYMKTHFVQIWNNLFTVKTVLRFQKPIHALSMSLFMWSMWVSIRVFITVCPRHCERNSCHNVKIFLLPSGFPAQIVTHIWRAKGKICSTFAFEFFSQNLIICLIHSIQFFYFHFKNINFFVIEQKLKFLRCFSHGTIFFAQEFLLSQIIVIKMWIDCEKNSNVIWYRESQCERNSAHIVRRLWEIRIIKCWNIS